MLFYSELEIALEPKNDTHAKRKLIYYQTGMTIVKTGRLNAQGFILLSLCTDDEFTQTNISQTMTHTHNYSFLFYITSNISTFNIYKIILYII